ncbi:organoarsenical effux MFS transporter ArsJ [Pleionea sp. CnH1-48]|uniref:organoarsenical effux MFS transporter ArsJ n=1 Tax=Pleionea sp. CnH1-48 TaxID=2954494 RepID=UPI002097531A|nr:organoarsenical effux MFS transporter ArsJ [Pleionea sp. CnH1-48]MCO7224161.1 organoarsenical effux MFS transporter ArsJ [Pleionea sp. CnH1-48]
MNSAIRQYLTITGNYWVFTVTDGALRLLVVLHFHALGYSALEIASLFLFYEFFGVVTNLMGGLLAARMGLNRTMQIGTLLQVMALAMLAVNPEWLSVFYVMCAQALSGIAKDLNKMSAKSSIKLLAVSDDQSSLYRWVAILTGSKNALKGAGFFVGALLLSTVGFSGALYSMSSVLLLSFIVSSILLTSELGKTEFKPKFTQIFSKSRAINQLSAARFFLFGARDVWFVVAVPVFLQAQLNWLPTEVGTLMACWVIGYGIIQASAPKITGYNKQQLPDGRAALKWAMLLTVIPAAMAIALGTDWPANWVLIIGLMVFGAVFAINSSLHSFLIVDYASSDRVSLDVGFYYMANAAGRLAGTLLSGAVYVHYGLAACLWVSAAFIATTSAISLGLPSRNNRLA